MTSYIGLGRAALESFVRTFIQSFIGALAVVNFATVDVDGAQAAVIAAASAALAAAVAAVGRVLAPLATDKAGVAVKKPAEVT